MPQIRRLGLGRKIWGGGDAADSQIRVGERIFIKGGLYKLVPVKRIESLFR